MSIIASPCRSIIVITILLFIALPKTVYPQGETGYPTDEELVYLPRYCQDRVKGSQEAAEYWSKLLGRENWIALHHYCAGLNSIKRADKATDKNARLSHLKSAYSTLKKYAIEESTQDFVLKHEVYYFLGKVDLRLGKNGEGIAALETSIRLKPNFVPAYTSLSDYYMNIGNAEESKKVLLQGLKYQPKSKSLHRRMAKFKE